MKKKNKQAVRDSEVRNNSRRFSITEDPTLLYSDKEIEGCTVIPKGTFVVFEKMGYFDETEPMSDMSRISSSSILEKNKRKEVSV